MTATARSISRHGWIPDLPDHRDRIYNLEENILAAHQLPGKVDLSPQMPPIVDQGQLGSCVGNGVARCLEYEAARQGEPMVTPSRLFIYYGARAIEGTVGQDAGAQIRDGIKVVASDGTPPETDWPYDISQFAVKPSAEAYVAATGHEAIQYRSIVVNGPGAPMRTALAAGLPIVFGFSVPASFEDGSWNPATSPLPLPGPADQIIGGHCVVITGYDFTCTKFAVPAFQCDNSWGADWGTAGRFWMAWDWFDPWRGLASDLWVIERVK